MSDTLFAEFEPRPAQPIDIQEYASNIGANAHAGDYEDRTGAAAIDQGHGPANVAENSDTRSDIVEDTEPVDPRIIDPDRSQLGTGKDLKADKTTLEANTERLGELIEYLRVSRGTR